MSRLYKKDKYHISELANYVAPNDPRLLNIPWDVYPSMPHPQDKEGQNKYNSNPLAQFGSDIFEDVCLKVKPDIVISITDEWMCEYQLRSPYRNKYKLLWCPTIDGAPQRQKWLDEYARADCVLTYSQFGKDVLEKEAPSKIDVKGILRPCVDPDVYKPLNKKALRKQFGIPENAYVIVTVARNQPRKLYADLLKMFAEYIKFCVKNGNEDLAKNTYLLCHTSFPDVGYALDMHTMQNGVGHRVLYTHVCHKCKAYYPDFFQTELTTCKRCGSYAAHLPNTNHGIEENELANLYNLADLYMGYVTCEGMGMGVAEAKSCEIPAMAVDYSAVAEQVNTEGCWPIKVKRFFAESVQQTEQWRALPDDEDAIQKIYNFFNLPQSERNRLGKLAREDAVNNYSFDRATSVLEAAIDSIEVPDQNDTWLAPIKLLDIPTKIPRLKHGHDLVDWCIDNILQKPEMKSSYWRNDLIKSLNTGHLVGRQGKEKFTIQDAVKHIINMTEAYNFHEEKRVATLMPQPRNGIRFEVI